MMPLFDLSVLFFTVNLYDYLSPGNESLLGCSKYVSSVSTLVWGIAIAVQVAKVYSKLT